MSFQQQLHFQVQRGSEGVPTTPTIAQPTTASKALTVQVTQRETISSPSSSPLLEKSQSQSLSAASYSHTTPPSFQIEEDSEEQESETLAAIFQPFSKQSAVKSPSNSPSAKTPMNTRASCENKQVISQEPVANNPIVPAHNLPPRTQRSFQPPGYSAAPEPTTQSQPLQPQPPILAPRKPTPPSGPPPRSAQPPPKTPQPQTQPSLQPPSHSQPALQVKLPSPEHMEPEIEPPKAILIRATTKVEANEAVLAAIATKVKGSAQAIKVQRPAFTQPAISVSASAIQGRPSPPPKVTQPPAQSPQLPSQPADTPSATNDTTDLRPVQPASNSIQKKSSGQFEPKPPKRSPPSAVQSLPQPTSQPIQPRSFIQISPKTTQPPIKRVSSFSAPSRVLSKIRLKCTYTDTRFVELPEDTITLDELQSSIRKKFLRDASQSDLLVRFKDPDGHIVTVVCDEDLQAAIQEYKITDLYLFDN